MSLPTDTRDLERYTETKTELERVLTVREHGGVTAAAAVLGLGIRTVASTLTTLRGRRDEAEAGKIAIPDQHVPTTQKVAGVSKMVKTEDGLPMWIKMKADAQAERERMEEILASWEAKLPRAPAVKRKKSLRDPDEDLLNLYLVTDYHMGMKAFGPETRGDNWDMRIAENLLIDWFREAIEKSPPAHTAVFGQLGDFAHWDSLIPETPTSKNIVDADTRYTLMIRICIRVFRTVVAMLLQKYERVVILHAEGNHDIVSSVHFREWSAVMYENEPRVEVIQDMDPYYLVRHGEIALAFHHGHLVKMAKIDKVLAAKFRQHYGQTQHFYAHMGHLHHDVQIETDLMTIEQHQTLAAPDSYASRHGYSSARSAKVLTYHKRYGEVSRLRLPAEMVYEL